jgi:hypothetical protein
MVGWGGARTKGRNLLIGALRQVRDDPVGSVSVS